MQIRSFRLNLDDAEAEAALNKFLRSVRVLQVQKEFVNLGAQSFWSLCVEYVESASVAAKNAPRSRVDYKEVLSPKDFELFAKLRDLRKEIAAEEAVPVYAVCTNEQLAEIARQRTESLTDLKKIDGLGDAKVEKYGERLLEIVARETRESGFAAREKEND
jgi:superfamily II DNA helicase RecQ